MVGLSMGEVVVWVVLKLREEAVVVLRLL